jgi:hypothetical protein
MKRSTNLLLVLLLLSANLFAVVPTKTVYYNNAQKTSEITFSTLPSKKGIEVKFKKGTEGKAVIIIYDNDKNVLRKDVLSDAKSLEKGYILTTLDNGDYTVEVTLNKMVMKKAIHVYNEGQSKMFIIKS